MVKSYESVMEAIGGATRYIPAILDYVQLPVRQLYSRIVSLNLSEITCIYSVT